MCHRHLLSQPWKELALLICGRLHLFAKRFSGRRPIALITFLDGKTKPVSIAFRHRDAHDVRHRIWLSRYEMPRFRICGSSNGLYGFYKDTHRGTVSAVRCAPMNRQSARECEGYHPGSPFATAGAPPSRPTASDAILAAVSTRGGSAASPGKTVPSSNLFHHTQAGESQTLPEGNPK